MLVCHVVSVLVSFSRRSYVSSLKLMQKSTSTEQRPLDLSLLDIQRFIKGKDATLDPTIHPTPADVESV